MKVPRVRIRSANKAPVNESGDYVLYWMTAYRRPEWNFALDRAIEAAHHLGKGLVVLEALRVGYQWASDRHHAFILEGMVDNAAAFAESSVVYFPYVEPRVGDGKGLLEALSGKACMVVTDDFPAFMLPKMTDAAAAKIGVRMERVDSNGIYPMRHTDRVFSRAHDFRRHLQKTIAPHLLEFPNPNPLHGLALPKPTLPDVSRWPKADVAQITTSAFLASLPIDHSVTRAEDRGGFVAARERLAAWVTDGLPRYGVDRNHPDTDASSRLSFWLHFGQLSAHERPSCAVTDGTGWAPDHVAPKASGSREGWWTRLTMSRASSTSGSRGARSGFMCARFAPMITTGSSRCPTGATNTGEHADDPREYVLLEEFEQAGTHDPT
ncbi:MAG: deoxyribodipyrimidine photolyase [bacterium]